MTSKNPAPTATNPVSDRRVQPDGPLSGEVQRGGDYLPAPGNPWPRPGDMRAATEAARGDNAKIAALADQISRVRRLNPGIWATPIVPVVVAPLDVNGVRISLDCEVIACRFRDLPRLMPDSWYRAKVVGIGDPGLPGRVVIRIRPYGGTYTEVSGAGDLEVHQFDEVAWVQAEEAAAHGMMRATWSRKAVDLDRCLFGEPYHEEFQRRAATAYVKQRSA